MLVGAGYMSALYWADIQSAPTNLFYKISRNAPGSVNIIHDGDCFNAVRFAFKIRLVLNGHVLSRGRTGNIGGKLHAGKFARNNLAQTRTDLAQAGLPLTFGHLAFKKARGRIPTVTV